MEFVFMASVSVIIAQDAEVGQPNPNF